MAAARMKPILGCAMSARVAAILSPVLASYRIEHRGEDPEVDLFLLDVAEKSATYREELHRLKACAAGGTQPVPSVANPCADAAPSQHHGSCYLTVAEVAALLGIKPRGVRAAAQRKRLVGRKVARTWQFAKEDVEDYKMHQKAKRE